VSDSDPLKFLTETEPEFDFIEGLEGGSYIADYMAGDESVFEFAKQAIARDHDYRWERLRRQSGNIARRYVDTPSADDDQMLAPRQANTAAAKFAQKILQSTRANPPIGKTRILNPRTPVDSRGRPVYMEVSDRWPYPWPVNHFVWQAPEGSGKSSIVPELVERGFKVVFCSKSNNQLVEQEKGFKSKFPELRIQRYVSKARHLQERLSELGIDFKLVYYEGNSPYAHAAIDEPSTRQALRMALDDAGYASVDHRVFFDKCYSTYKSPPIVGLQTDVVLLTIAAFQAFCTARHRPWWHALGLFAGKKRIVKTSREYADWSHHREVPKIVDTGEFVPSKDDHGWPQKAVELGLDGIIVIVDDPDRTDFDFRRLIEDEDLAEIHSRRKALPVYQQQWVHLEHWTKMGYPPYLAAELAREFTNKARAHAIEAFQKKQFEARPTTQYIGYGLRRGFREKDGWGPKILITTTEHITAKLAHMSLGKAMKWSAQCTSKYARTNGVGWYSHHTHLPTKECHVTLLSTRLVRKADRVLLLLIAEVLRQEFPGDNLAFIADGLQCELNLMNNRGRNDLADRSTLIKLSVPNPTVAVNLWAQFPTSESPKLLNTILLADLANQAIGRNQGRRYRGKQCMVLIDPLYANLLVNSGLLRYRCTPWSFHEPPAEALPRHYPKTSMEVRLTYLLDNIRNFAMGRAGMTIGFNLPDAQRALYLDWLDRNNVVYQHLI
jgi:hypothetical protein